MIFFKRISYKNILSVGQAPVTLELSSCRLTSLHGPSGSGKSLFLDALSFALFGRAFRDINKTSLINTINGKGLFVELDFQIGSQTYTIRRGIKPNIFEIIVDGSLLPQEAHVKDQQKYLEDQILKMNWRIFTQVIMLGAANYTPFMRLKPSERRKMVENIIGIDVFSTMNALVKEKIADAQNAYKSIIQKIETNTTQVAYLREQQESFEKRLKDEVASATIKLKSLLDSKKRLDAGVKAAEAELASLLEAKEPEEETLSPLPPFNETFDETFEETFSEEFHEIDLEVFSVVCLVQQKTEASTRRKQAEKASEDKQLLLRFYSENNSCETCGQHIHEEFKTTTIAALKKEIVQNQYEQQMLLEEIGAIQKVIDQTNTNRMEYLKQFEDFKARKRDYEQRKSAFNARLLAFEERRRNYEMLMRKRDEQIRNVNTLRSNKIKEQNLLATQKRESIERLRREVAEIVVEAKCIKESIDEKRQKPLLDNKDEIERIESENIELGHKIDGLAQTLKMLREVQVVIRDDGVKGEILRKYLPTLNKHINWYLEKMGMYVSLELDQEFNDTIKRRHRDPLSYSNYSEGERQRIDLAVLFAWRNVAQTQSSINTNILILDEVLDSHLDQQTTEAILSLMKGDEFAAYNIFVITHKDNLIENFDRVLQFQMRNNFTSVMGG